MKTMEELGSDLCKYCLPTDRGEHAQWGYGDCYGCCEEAFCDEAYETYIEEEGWESELLMEEKMDKEERENIIKIDFTVSQDQLEQKVSDTVMRQLEAKIINRLVDNCMARFERDFSALQNEVLCYARESITKKIQEVTDNIYDNFIVQVPVSTSWNSETVPTPLKTFVLNKIQEQIEKGVLEYRDGYSTKSVSFTDYFKNKINKDITDEAGKIINSKMEEVKQEVNKNLQTAFESATKQMLSEQVFNILMSNDTYRKIENGIKYLGGSNNDK